jgi:hypothetical protein
MKLKKLIVILLFIFTLNNVDCYSQQYPGTNLRGKVLTQDNYGRTFPITYAQVDLYLYNSATNQWILIQSTLTDAYGFYFLNWIIPNSYVIQINKIKNYNISVVWIDYNLYRYQDIPVLYF